MHIHLICGDVIEKIFALFVWESAVRMVWVKRPKLFTEVEQIRCAHYIGIDKSIWR